MGIGAPIEANLVIKKGGVQDRGEANIMRLKIVQENMLIRDKHIILMHSIYFYPVKI
jgi:hypothetical protein